MKMPALRYLAGLMVEVHKIRAEQETLGRHNSRTAFSPLYRWAR
jgi:hypothetical protein